MRRFASLLLACLVGTTVPCLAADFETAVDMRATDAATFYVNGRITGVGVVNFMVDTGSGYLTINEQLLQKLRSADQVRYVKDLRGRLANGSELKVPVYSIAELSIGDGCWLNDIEAVIFPGKTRAILGLNALQHAAPFIFSFDPPRLTLSNCRPNAIARVAGSELADARQATPGKASDAGLASLP